MRIIRTATISLGILSLTVGSVCAELPGQTIEFLDQHCLEVRGMHRRPVLAAVLRGAQPTVDGRRARTIRQFQYGFGVKSVDSRCEIDRCSRSHDRLAGRA